MSGEQDTASTYDFYKKCKDRFLDAGLDLRKWSTNDVLRNNINTAEKLTQDKPEISGIKVSGVNWDRINDFLQVDLNKISKES